jgi:hypothetical protein
VSEPLRLVVYDVTQRTRPPKGLGLAWHAGTYLYRGLGRIDAAFGARDWSGALAWLVEQARERPIAEIQYWGHGRWGRALIDGESLDRAALSPGHALERPLAALRERLVPNALVWFRTCETLGARPGQDFARAFSDRLHVRVAGHTFVIGFFQSGLHLLSPGNAPSWSVDEGLARGTPANPELALSSGPNQPNTVTCLSGEVPAGY